MPELNIAQKFVAQMIQHMFGDHPIPANDVDFLDWAGSLSHQVGGQWMRDHADWLINSWEQGERERYRQKLERGEPYSMVIPKE